MTTTLTKVQPEKFIKIAEKVGLTVLRQPSQWRISDPKDASHRLYVPGQKVVHKVELSGWSHERAVAWDTMFPGKKAPSPKITHVLDFTKTEKEILRDFFIIARSLLPASSSPVIEEATPSEEMPAAPEAISA
jgi:hypothetical protein